MGARGSFKMHANHAALDFVNTFDDRFSESPLDLIENYGRLLRFAEQANVLTPAEAASLQRAAKRTETIDILRRAIALREVLARIFYAKVEGEPINAADLDSLNRTLGSGSAHRILREANGKYEWTWDGGSKSLEVPLWAIAQAAAQLLVSADLILVRQCGNETCRWLFLDTSKNHSRRWCDMKTCGNRVKARRFYSAHSRD